MTQEKVPPGSIVVGVDGSDPSARALDWAIDQAGREQRALTIAHSLQPLGASASGVGYGGLDDGPGLAALRGTADTLLADAVTLARRDLPDLRVRSVLGFGDPRVQLLDLSAHAALVVVGTRGRGPLVSMFLGSVSVAVAKRARCPIVVVRAADSVQSQADPQMGVAVAVDGTAKSMPAIEKAYRMASLRGLRLTVLHCYWDSRPVMDLGSPLPASELEAQRALVAESVAGMAEKFPDVGVDVRLVRGDPVRALIDASDGCGLLVLGHQRGSRLEDLLHGSVSSQVLESARCDVVVVPSEAPCLPAT